MKGIVFEQLKESMEELWIDRFWDEMLKEAELPSEGINTTVGIYDERQLITLIGLVLDKQNILAKDGQFAFGKWVFKESYNLAPWDVHYFKDVFGFFPEIPNQFLFHYQSPRKLCFFCEGILHGHTQNVGQEVKVSQPKCEHEGVKRCVLVVENL